MSTKAHIFETNRKAVPVMGAATHSLALLALVVVIVEASFGVAVFKLSGPAQTMSITGMILLLILVVAIAGWRWTAPTQETKSLSLLCGKDHLPLDPTHVDACEGTWRCQWSACTVSGEQVPYIDDTVTVKSVKPESGALRAAASPVYDKNPTGYEIEGCVSKRGLACLYYKFPPPHEEKTGLIILRIDFQREKAQGFWLGGGRGYGKPDEGGLVTWTRSERFVGEWVDHIYKDADGHVLGLSPGKEPVK